MKPKHTKTALALIFGLVTGLVALWIIRKRQSGWVLPTAWQRCLVQRHGAQKTGSMVEAIRGEYALLLAGCSLPTNPALRTHLTQNILPGLALYRVLLAEYNGDRSSAMTEVDQVFRAWTEASSRRLFAPLKILPLPAWLFRLVFSLMMKSYPAEGWDFEPVENSPTRIAFNATRCYYLNTLTALGAPELTPAFCRNDDVMAENFPGAIRFVRTQTLGRGDKKCDFQYCLDEALAR